MLVMSEHSQEPTERESRPIYQRLKNDLMYFCYGCNEENMDFKFSDLESPNRNWNWVAIGAECTGINKNSRFNSNWLVGVSQIARYDDGSGDSCKPYFVDVHIMKLEDHKNTDILKVYTIEEEEILIDILTKNGNEYYASSAYDAKPTEIIELMTVLYNLDSPNDISLQLRKIPSQSKDALMRRYANEIYAFLNCCDSLTYPTNKQRYDDIKLKFTKYISAKINKMLGMEETK